jgi:hypothetical protein
MENNILASSTLAMAIATLMMASVTYISYDKLITIQEASFEPALAVNFNIQKMNVKIKNDGPGIAKNIILYYCWAFRQVLPGKVERYDIGEGDFEREIIINNVGNIGSKESRDDIVISRPHNLPSNIILYALRLRVTCEDQFGKRLDKYADIKTISTPGIDIIKT